MKLGKRYQLMLLMKKSPTENIQQRVAPTLKLSENRKLVILKRIAWQALVGEKER